MAKGGNDQHVGSELEATIAARKALGPDYEPALVESFVDKIDAEITARVDARVEQHEAELDRRKEDDGAAQRGFVMGLVSLGTGIPITAIAGGTADLPGVLVAWCGIVGVNVAHAWSARRRR